MLPVIAFRAGVVDSAKRLSDLAFGAGVADSATPAPVVCPLLF